MGGGNTSNHVGTSNGILKKTVRFSNGTNAYSLDDNNSQCLKNNYEYDSLVKKRQTSRKDRLTYSLVIKLHKGDDEDNASVMKHFEFETSPLDNLTTENFNRFELKKVSIDLKSETPLDAVEYYEKSENEAQFYRQNAMNSSNDPCNYLHYDCSRFKYLPKLENNYSSQLKQLKILSILLFGLLLVVGLLLASDNSWFKASSNCTGNSC